VRARRVYKTLPQQAFVENAASSARGIELRVGSIEREQTHAYLITLLAPPSAGTTLEVARATLTFDVPALGLRAQQQDVALSVAVGAAARTADTEISGAYRRAQIARLVDELADAQRRNAKDECLDRVELLIRLCDEAGDDRMRATYEQLRDSIVGDRAIAQKALNAVVIASTDQAASGPIKQLYDVVLVAAGDDTILLLRALRDATGKSLRELTDLIAMTPIAIHEALPQRDAETLVAQIAKNVTGAVLEVRPR
jgi:ribosomal protein L7/L12